MNQDSITFFLISGLPALCRDDVHGEAGYAFPAASLTLLAECVARLQIRRVFEFGSGQSTRQFLGGGCEVAAVENDESCLASTSASLARRPLIETLKAWRRYFLAQIAR